MRKLLLALSALLILVLIVLSVVAAMQRPPLIDGSNARSQPLPWSSQKLIQGVFDYRVWSGARSGFIAMFAHEGEIVYAITAGDAKASTGLPNCSWIAVNTPLEAAAISVVTDFGRIPLILPWHAIKLILKSTQQIHIGSHLTSITMETK